MNTLICIPSSHQWHNPSIQPSFHPSVHPSLKIISTATCMEFDGTETYTWRCQPRHTDRQLRTPPTPPPPPLPALNRKQHIKVYFDCWQRSHIQSGQSASQPQEQQWHGRKEASHSVGRICGHQSMVSQTGSH